MRKNNFPVTKENIISRKDAKEDRRKALSWFLVLTLPPLRENPLYLSSPSSSQHQ